MNVFYEEEGEFRVGSILTDNETSLQVEAPHGKRSKVKASAVLLRFAAPSHQVFMAEAQQLADAIDLDFLWQCCSEDEFAYASLAEEYYGHAPSVLESASVLIRLHAAPMYFYKKGRGRYKAAPQAALQAALASVDHLIEARGFKQLSDTGALEATIDTVIAANTKSVDEFRAGKEKALNALVGQIMKATKGQANPAQVTEMLRRKLVA